VLGGIDLRTETRLSYNIKKKEQKSHTNIELMDSGNNTGRKIKKNHDKKISGKGMINKMGNII